MAAAAAFLLVATVDSSAASGDSQPVHLVSPGDPYAACDISGDGPGTNYPSTEDEPYVTASPRDPRDAVGVFQQDRWSNGGARGLTATYTHDGRHFTETPLPFSHCAPGGLDYQRASDGWVSTGPDGTVYASGLVLDATDARNGVAASTSYDGGRTWTHTVPLIEDTQIEFADDKNSVTADPVHPGVAYQVWDRIDEDDSAQVYDGPAYISLTRDGGRHWTKARPFVDTSVVPHSQTIGNVIVVDPRTDTLYDVFDWQTYDIDYTTGTFTPTDLHFAMVRSTDQGRTWSKPVTIARDTAVGEVDPNAPDDPAKALRAGGDLPSVAIDPHTGELYVAYEGSDFNGGAYNSVELTRSTDGGRTWSAPKRVNSVASAPAFTPSISVDARGTVAITYYDLRYLTPGNTATLPTAAWLVTLPHGAENGATERRISRVFDWLQAPYARGHFLGDYEGLVTDGPLAVRPLFVESHADAPQNSTDAYSGLFPSGAGHGPLTVAPATAAPRAAAPRAARPHRMLR
ncbi:sialidase family protein [Streptomyces sp. NK08204]|uniref:sialidase family protein n=1 Tax=Streptomyces sp. NK08204 TaxID=2873260 RepID=UPI001CED187D|nr:sialidase family protein [Streptomyces sp. NK08204]